MTADIAKAMVAGTGSLYPLFAPIVGALGAFLTGSGTNSNVLFGPLQIAAAQGLDPTNWEDLGFWLALLTPVQLVSVKCCLHNPSRFPLVP